MKRYLLVKDQKRRKSFLKSERTRFMLKYITCNLDFSDKIRAKAFQKLSNFKKNAYSVRIKNRCMFTGRGPFTLSHFKISRIIFREKASFGKITGVKKAS